MDIKKLTRAEGIDDMTNVELVELDKKSFGIKLATWICSTIGLLAVITLTPFLVKFFQITLEEFGFRYDKSYNDFLARGVMIGWTIVVTLSFVNRSNLAKWLRICVCLSCMIFIPVGTLFGILGLILLSKSSLLFGPEKIGDKYLQAEIKKRKSETNIY